MPRYHRISYTHEPHAPRYPGNPENRVELTLDMQQGAHCNAGQVTLFNHNGTHVDFPNHFHAAGRRGADYAIDELVFTRPILIAPSLRPGQAIEPAQLAPFERQLDGCDLLLLKTGLGRRRGEPAYLDNAYLSVEAARRLRAVPSLRAIALDTISAANPTRPEARPVGREVHQLLLGEAPGRGPILILEDVDLSDDALISRFRRVFVVPLFVAGIDGMPCTIFGEYD